MKKLIIIYILISFNLNSKDSRLEIYTESYSGTKETYMEDIEGFIKHDSELLVIIDNDSIFNEFIYLINKIEVRNKFHTGQTKTILILENECYQDTFMLNRGDSRKEELKKIVRLTDTFFPLNYKVW